MDGDAGIEDLHDEQALAAFRVPWQAFASLRRRSRHPTVLAERAYPIFLVLTTALLAAALELSMQQPLVRFIALATVLMAIASAATAPYAHHMQGGDNPRHAHLRGRRLIVRVGASTRSYDLTTARIQCHGDWCALSAPSGRWVPDIVPRLLVEHALDEAAGEPLEAPIAAPRDEVVVHRRGLGAATRVLAWSSTNAAGVGVLLALLLLFLALVPLRGDRASLAIPIAMGWAFIHVSIVLTNLLAPIQRFCRGMRFHADELGLAVRDGDYVEHVRWSGNPVKRFTDDAVLVARPLTIYLHRTGTSDPAFDGLVARIRRHALPRTGGARLGGGIHLALVNATITGALVVAMLTMGAGSITRYLRSSGDALFVLIVISVVLPNVYALARVRLATRPATERVSHDRVHRSRFAGALAAAVLLIVPGALVVAIVAAAYLDAPLALRAVLLAAPFLLLLLAIRSVDGVRAFERLAVIVAGVSVGGGLLLIDAWRRTLRVGIEQPLVLLLALAALVVLVSIAARRSSSRAHPARASALALAPAAVATSLLLAGPFVLDIRADATFAADAPAAAARSELVRSVRVDKVPIATAWNDAHVLDVRWRAGRAHVTLSAQTQPSEQPFAGAPGRRAIDRLERLLTAAAAQPGHAPVLRRIVLARSPAAVRVHAAMAGLGSGPVQPAYLVRTLDDAHRGRWSNASLAEMSHYHGTSDAIIMQQAASIDLLRLLRAPRGIRLDDRQHSAFGQLLHELEHAMTTHGNDPQWILEGVAESVPSWGRASTAYARAIDVRLPRTEFGRSDEYREWASNMDYLMWRCGFQEHVGSSHIGVMQLLRPTDGGSIADAIAQRLVDEQATKLSRGALAELIRAAHDEDGAERLWDALEYPDYEE